MNNANELSFDPSTPDTLDMLLAKYYRSQQNVATLLAVREQILETGNKAMQERDAAQDEARHLSSKVKSQEFEIARLKVALERYVEQFGPLTEPGRPEILTLVPDDPLALIERINGLQEQATAEAESS